jgi:hypothetical protein
MLLKRIINLQGVQFINLLCIVALSLMTIIGCGGGGDDGGDGGGAASLQATVTSGNAQDLVAGALVGGLIGSAFNVASTDAEPATNEHNVSFRWLRVAQVLEDALLQVDLSPQSDGPFITATQNVSETIPGSCGGTASYTLQYDEVSGDFSGSFSYNNYCDGNNTISGDADFTGTFDLSDPNNPTFETMTFTFTNLTTGDIIMNGAIDFDLTSSPETIIIDVSFQDISTGKVYRVENYVVYITEDLVDTIIEISSGNWHDPDYGYVNVSTTTEFILHHGYEWPASGVLIVTGANNTKARLTAKNSSQCLIDADTDGDGAYDDWTTGAWINYTDL